MRGLTGEEAAKRFEADGPNELARPRGPSVLSMLLAQFKSAVVLLLVAACVLSIALGELGDSVAILAILVLNAGVGFIQEFRAERALLALRDLTAPRARVLRDGHARMIAAREVVRGDVLLLEAGDVVAADALLLEANALTTREAALTGESQPVEKVVAELPAGTPLAERRNAVFAGTIISSGTGQASVTAVGVSTEIGHIAHLLTTAEERETPLQTRLAQVSRMLLLACLGVVVVVAASGFARGEHWLSLLMSSVSLAVAAVPEGLPAIVTIALAVGVQRMARTRALVRHLPAVETLGCTTVICTDKTGTLTTGVMEVRDVAAADVAACLHAAAACCDAALDDQEGAGDTTELAILRSAAQQGITRDAIERDAPRVATVPFDSSRRRMSIKRADGVLYVKGAFESLLALCTSGTEGMAEANTRLAARALRVIAVAVGTGDDEKNLRLLGLIGIADAPRPEAIEAIAAARRAGIRTVMITGDHPLTADAIAREMGLVLPGESSDGRVHARATAEDKLKIVRVLKAEDHVVAMTGDGVNDAPALRESDVGIAMGRTGTEVTRETADIILTDDNFASIVAAVREGRAIYDNIRKALFYLLSGNTAELAVMLGASLCGFPLPLIPLQLLWINLVTDGFPALALVMEPAEGDVMARAPRAVNEPILTRGLWLNIVTIGFVEALAVLGVYAWTLEHHGVDAARSDAFTTLVLSELARAFACRSSTRTTLELGFATNRWLLAAAGGGILLQLAIMHTPVLSELLGTLALTWRSLILPVAAAAVPVAVMEVGKLVRRPRAAGVTPQGEP